MEEIGQLIGKGFGIWKKNLNLCIPYICSGFALFLAAIAFFMVVILLEIPITDGSLGEPSSQNVFTVLSLILILSIIYYLAEAFFKAGAIGMARQALEERRSTISSLWPAGKKHFWNMFLMSLIMGLVTMAGLIFLLPGIEQLGKLLSENPSSLDGLGIILAGFLLFILYALLLSIILSPAPYALVLEDTGPVQALKAGIDFFRYNKFDVLILWLVIAALSLVLQMIGSSFSMGEQDQPLWAITTLANLIVLAPLANLWWTMLYMSRKGMIKEEEVKDPW